ncbi:hypothetical protein IJ182_05480 [bacterium]|nr:hypothetical protein [bacterium]
MKISSLPNTNMFQLTKIPLKHNNKISFNKNVTSELKLKSLDKDTVSFGFNQGRVDPDIQLYRCIGQSEYDSLMAGERVLSSGYLTSDPKGWKAYNWNSGFHDFKTEQNYFITFKKNHLFVCDARDDEEDTRYVTHSSYTLDDIDNIRRGTNVHGEMVYAENDEMIVQDIQQKKLAIANLLSILKTSSNPTDRANAWDELISYSVEFPEIILNLVKDIVDFNSQEDVYGYSTIITKYDSPEYMDEYRKCLHSYVSTDIMPSVDFSYLMHHAQKEDLPDIMKIIDKEKIYSKPAAVILDRISDEDYVINNLLEDNIKKLDILCYYLKDKNSDGKYNNLFSIILQKAQNIEIDPYSFTGGIAKDSVVRKCKEQLSSKSDK